MLPKIPDANYTQIPNVVLDKMCEFTHTEFKVAIFICRYTCGFHRDGHKMSYSFIENGTGLHRETVSNAIQTLHAKGFLVRESSGDSYVYGLNWENPSLQTPQPVVVGDSDQSESGSRRFRPPLVGDSDQQVVGDSDHLYKERVLKEREKEREPLSVELPQGFPSTAEEAKVHASFVGCPKEFAVVVWNKAMGRGARDAKEVLIRSFRHHLQTEWSYEQSRQNEKQAKENKPAGGNF